ncbi:16S rRNA (cytidine(1402)-2'-O)-methyltransferase [Legionella spiritensis]|uniref:Ribosomal RNA small subunit methyltransferase I n=1 Tax=Legionella spiritensis TaxID=452 RepID=A0A0W0ZB46_LEGSP|nr:16S rRNA (cytidine(1402)-2'-O)-methyltransferase [Legionella spiritensis]KTD66369.1 tetrapyrrole (corrin/porphyrin) methylase [Legionella spiritensis]SNV48888.1 tetrapyrrole (corrin/porphyrin) methylase [Legionella spiritensis]VEG91581.1 tetrapyrrole (corrin/porphyrin) methylase [Legionella spiritensis]
MSTHPGGTLYVVATPIGNLDDISLRAMKTLKSVDVILAEDTRHSARLLQALGCDTPLLSHHAYNEAETTASIIDALLKGQSFALISDAGTPLISDPGFELVRKARQMAIPVIPVPGPCALTTALSAAGVPCDQFIFAGFLPAKQQARINKLRALYDNELTIIFYESTHRILDCMDDIDSVYGPDFQLVLAKELTKAFENFISGTAQQIKAWLLADKNHGKGEFVVILPPHSVPATMEHDSHLLTVLLQDLPLKQAVKLASALTKTHKNELYKLALKIQDTP